MAAVYNEARKEAGFEMTEKVLIRGKATTSEGQEAWTRFEVNKARTCTVSRKTPCHVIIITIVHPERASHSPKHT